MALDPLTAGLDLAKTAIDKIWPDAGETERAKMAAILAVTQGQLAVNTAEAANPSVFTSGWRPAIGWTCACALFYTYLLYPLLTWGLAIWAPSLSAPKLVTQDILFELLFGMLGLAGMRSFEKVKGVS